MHMLTDSGPATRATIRTLSATQATAYAGAAAVPVADRTPTQAAIVASGDTQLAAAAAAWSAQAPTAQPVADPADVMAFATNLQADVQRMVRQQVTRGFVEGSISEILSVLTSRMVDMERQILNLKARLDASPY